MRGSLAGDPLLVLVVLYLHDAPVSAEAHPARMAMRQDDERFAPHVLPILRGTTAPRGTETILLVDDDHAVRRMAQRALTALGYTVVVAHDGVDALTHARALPRVDVLLTDVVMPQLSGPQVAERLRRRHPSVRVVYMTGWVEDAIMKLELDADVALLRKPFTPVGLALLIRSALDQRYSPTATHA